MKILDRPFDAACNYHGTRLPPYFVGGQHLLVKVIHHNLALEPDGVVVTFDVPMQFLFCFFGIEFRIILNLLDQFVVALDGGVALEHIKDKPLIDRLLHGVAVEGAVLHLAFNVGRQRFTKHFEGFVFGCCRESEVAGVGQHFAGSHTFFERFVHRVFRIRLFSVRGILAGKRLTHCCRGLASLA